jgi:hypothetical protein
MYNNNDNPVALVTERPLPTVRPPLFGEVSANFGVRGLSRSQRGGSSAVVISIFYTGTANFSFK